MITFIGYASAIIIGLLVGFTLQRGRACTNSAFRNFLLKGNTELMMMIVVTVCVELIGYYILSTGTLGNDFTSNPLPFSYILIPVGGLIFGLGTVMAGGCAGGVCYRVGEGSVSSLLSLLGFATGIVLIGASPFTDDVNILRESTLLTIDGGTPSLSSFLPRIYWTVLAVIILIFTIYRYFKKQKNQQLKLKHLRPRWTVINTGIVLGSLGVLARYFSTTSGRAFGLSTTDGIAELFQSVFLFEPLGWAGTFIGSLIIGSAISAYLNGETKLAKPNKKSIPRFYGGGILLGMGAMLATGCNFGHIFGGIPELGLSSFAALIFMLLGNGLGSQLYYVKLDNEFPISSP